MTSDDDTQASATIPAGQGETKICPDCMAEGRDTFIYPIATHFYIKRAPKYPGGYRVSTYCKEHERKRIVERETERRREMAAIEEATGVTPPALAAMRERSRIRSQRKRDAVSPEERIAQAEQVRAEREALRAIDPARAEQEEADRKARKAKAYKTWAAKNKTYLAAKSYAWFLKNRIRLIQQRRKRLSVLAPIPAYQPLKRARRYRYRYGDETSMEAPTE